MLEGGEGTGTMTHGGGGGLCRYRACHTVINVKGETHSVMRRLSMAFDGLKNVNFIE